MYNFEPYNILLTIATKIAVLLMTASVLQGHIFKIYIFKQDAQLITESFECWMIQVTQK